MVADNGRVRIGVVALQGDYAAHTAMVVLAGADALPVRTADEIADVEGLILPGGESTVIGKLMARYGLDTAIRNAHATGKPIFGTCAGMILLADRIVSGAASGGQPTLELMHISVARNAFGRQIDSFETDIDAPIIAGDTGLPVRAVFIRAPYIVDAGGDVEVLARFEEKIVMARQGNLLASAFHPELTSDLRVHRYFIDMVHRARETVR